jgi:hypothetical protein
MPWSANGGHRYEVHLSGAVAQSLRRLQREASREGRGKAVLSAIRQIVRRLTRDPLNFGEPLYRLPALRMNVRQGAIRPLFVDFAVCGPSSKEG